MEYLLSKLLPLFVYPLGLAILLGLLGIVMVLRNHRSAAVLSVLLGIAILWVSSTNVFSGFVIKSLEQDYPPVAVDHLPVVDAIVVLGGYTDMADAGGGIIEFGDAVDRLFHGMRLYRAGKAARLMLVGGAARGHVPEAEVMAGLLSEFGIPRSVMLQEGESRNTRENGMNAVVIIQKEGINKIILVTSAFHMRRAQAVFEKLGIEVVAAATDYQVLEPDPSILDWLPNAEALMMTTLGIKEYLGWWVYRARGWVD